MTEQTAPTLPQQSGIGVHLLAFLAGCASGLAFVQLFSGGFLGILIAYLSPLPIFLAALSGGRNTVITATVSGIIATLLRVTPMGAVIYAALIAVPTMVIARVTLLNYAARDQHPEYASAGTVLLTTLTVGTILMLALAAILQINGINMAAIVNDMVGSYKSMIAATNPELPADQIEQSLKLLAPAIPSVILMSWFIVMLINYGIAQYAAGEFTQPLRPRLAINQLQLPGWLAIIFVLCFAASPFVAPNMSMTLSALASLYGIGFILAGLGSMHRWIDARALRDGWTPSKRKGVYILLYLLIFVVQIPVFFLLLAGLIAPFTGWRHHSRTVVADTSGTESKE